MAKKIIKIKKSLYIKKVKPLIEHHPSKKNTESNKTKDKPNEIYSNECNEDIFNQNQNLNSPEEKENIYIEIKNEENELPAQTNKEESKPIEKQKQNIPKNEKVPENNENDIIEVNEEMELNNIIIDDFNLFNEMHFDNLPEEKIDFNGIRNISTNHCNNNWIIQNHRYNSLYNESNDECQRSFNHVNNINTHNKIHQKFG